MACTHLKLLWSVVLGVQSSSELSLCVWQAAGPSPSSSSPSSSSPLSALLPRSLSAAAAAAVTALTAPGSLLVVWYFWWTFLPVFHNSALRGFREKLPNAKMDWSNDPTTCGYLGGEKKESISVESDLSEGWVTVMEEDDGHQENGIPAAKDSDRQQRLRLCVLSEILNTERDYVRTLLFLQSVSLTSSRKSVSRTLAEHDAKLQLQICILADVFYLFPDARSSRVLF